MSDNRPIGIFDSGLGGLTVAREIIKILPDESIVYFGDTGRVPYGTRSEGTIKKYAAEDERFLLSKDVKLIVAACGTVSSVAANTGNNLPVPFVEVITHSVNAAVKATKNKKIGILATAATINSGAHKRYIKSLIPDAEVTECAGTLLVPLVEEGWTSKDDAVVTGTLERYLAPMIQNNVDTIILGCTHFPILAEAISEIMGKDLTLINMGTATALAIKESLEKSDNLSDGKAVTHKFFVSDKALSFKKTASVLLGEEIDENSVKQVDINSL